MLFREFFFKTEVCHMVNKLTYFLKIYQIIKYWVTVLY